MQTALGLHLAIAQQAFAGVQGVSPPLRRVEPQQLKYLDQELVKGHGPASIPKASSQLFLEYLGNRLVPIVPRICLRQDTHWTIGYQAALAFCA